MRYISQPIQHECLPLLAISASVCLFVTVVYILFPSITCEACLPVNSLFTRVWRCQSLEIYLAVADPDIRLREPHDVAIQTFGWGRKFNVSQYLTFISSLEKTKVYIYTEWGPWPDLHPLDPPLILGAEINNIRPTL